MRNELEANERGARGFATTHWSVVVQAGASNSPRATDALEGLCRAYWSPLYHYIRRRGHGPEDAQDLTQSFFAQLIEKNYLRVVDRQRGKFRTFLLTALKHFLTHEWEKARTQKRGGRFSFVSFADEQLHDREGMETSPECVYDKDWAMAVFEQALVHLRNEHERLGRLQQYERLKCFLANEPGEGEYDEAAAELKTTPGAIAVSVHRLRQGYGKCVRDVINETVSQGDQIEEELRYLITLVRS